MNTLGFVFSILMILSFGLATCLNKQVTNQKIRRSYLGHWHANRDILVQAETVFYNRLDYKRHRKTSTEDHKTPAPKREKKSHKQEKLHRHPKLNPPCAKLNLFPLIDKSRTEEPILYETAAKLFKTFYGDNLFENKAHREFHFLNALLAALRKTTQKKRSLNLEKLRFPKESDQRLYYHMLKGMKDQAGYPSLLDYIKVDKIPSKICPSHADPLMLKALFGNKAALHIYQTIHTSNRPHITKELFTKLCADAHTPIFDDKIFDLLEFKKLSHQKELVHTFLGEDLQSQISVKKKRTL